jgi:hypothetical protein
MTEWISFSGALQAGRVYNTSDMPDTLRARVRHPMRPPN